MTPPSSLQKKELVAELERLYPHLRCALIRFFENRRCWNSQDLADESIGRLVYAIESGREIENLPAFAHGIALHVLQEWLRDHLARAKALPTQLEAREPDEALEDHDACVRMCLKQLTPQERKMLKDYHQGDREDRERLSKSNDITPAALRLRVMRLRRKVTACCEKWLQKPGNR